MRGRIFFEDALVTGPDFKKGACAVCHSGPMLNQTNQFFENFPGLRFLSVAVSEFNVARNRSRPFIFRSPDGTSVTVSSPDPGRALIAGVPFVNGPPFLSDFNAFKISTLWGIKDTAPYFHDNSAKTLEDVVNHYAQFLLLTPVPAKFTEQDK